ncbi:MULTISPECIES: DUF1450 domain-containing protein [Enterococcus]|nr:DUF1450 domain-containing protein [Enterococcus alcedinis]
MEMFPLIEFCQSNLSSGTETIMERIEQMDEVDVMVSSCLSECTLCKQRPFCLFEGERLSANTPEELYVLIEASLATWREEYM